MIACIDVITKKNRSANAACVLNEQWNNSTPKQILTTTCEQVEDFIPGQFYRRELPCILAVLELTEKIPEIIIIDGYVWLGEKPGLGCYLYEALNKPALHLLQKFWHGRSFSTIIRVLDKSPMD